MLSWNAKGLGAHQFKAGLQYSWLIDRQATGEAGDQNFTDSGGVCKAPADPSQPPDPVSYQYCFKRTQFAGNQGGSLYTRATASDIGLFIQDRWTVNRQLTVIPGVRIDAGILYGDPYANTDGSTNAPKFTNLAGIGPRLSVTYDLLGDRRWLL